jgi:hypothetical protein
MFEIVSQYGLERQPANIPYNADDGKKESIVGENKNLERTAIRALAEHS